MFVPEWMVALAIAPWLGLIVAAVVPGRRAGDRQNQDSSAVKDDEDCACAICMEQAPREQRVELVCGHGFHGRCISKWLASDIRGLCPLCRKQIHIKSTSLYGLTLWAKEASAEEAMKVSWYQALSAVRPAGVNGLGFY